MMNALNDQTLVNENRRFVGTGGRSEENRAQGFVPAFRDADSGAVYRSCFRDGRPAPIHLLDGLPDTLRARCAGAARASVVAGFLLAGRFYTREEAAAAACSRARI